MIGIVVSHKNGDIRTIKQNHSDQWLVISTCPELNVNHWGSSCHIKLTVNDHWNHQPDIMQSVELHQSLVGVRSFASKPSWAVTYWYVVENISPTRSFSRLVAAIWTGGELQEYQQNTIVMHSCKMLQTGDMISVCLKIEYSICWSLSCSEWKWSIRVYPMFRHTQISNGWLLSHYILINMLTMADLVYVHIHIYTVYIYIII
jgi:hypothetical protein